MAISFSTFVLLSWVFPETYPQIHQLISIAPAMFVNYFLNSYWTFRDKELVGRMPVASAAPGPSTAAVEPKRDL
jgi:putative flippase GtrA